MKDTRHKIQGTKKHQNTNPKTQNLVRQSFGMF